jgi:DNA-binding response OmpR family regulator
VYKVPSGSDKHARYELGDLIFDFDQQKLTLKDKVVTLTSKESKLLKLFCIHRNKVIERDIILKAIWEDEGYFVGRSMDVFVSRLRKIFKDNNRVSIQTIHGVGYKLNIDQVDSDVN